MPNVTATIYSCSDDKSIKSWKIAGDMPMRNLAGHGNLVDAVSFSPDGHTLASCSHDGTIRLWNPHDGKQQGEVKLTPQPLYCLTWRGDGKQLAIGSFDHSIRLINVADKKVEREIKGFDEKSAANGHNDAVYSVAYAGNDQLYSAGADGKIKLWNINDGGMVKTFIDPALKDKAQRDFINTIKLTKDGKKLVAVGNGGWVTIWNTADGKMIHSQKLPIGLYGLSIHPDGNSFATGNMNGTIYVIKMP
jgi:WD40 repeat protein